MSWREKLLALRRALPDETLIFVFDVAEPALEEFVAQTRDMAPYLPQSYCDFLSFTDGAQMDYFVLFGSGQSQFPPLAKAMDRWRPTVGTLGFVIGEDASGAAFLIRRDGGVVLVGTDPPDLDQAELVATSFDDLLDQVFMGPRYFDLFPQGVRSDNEWVQLLEKHGWLGRRGES